jgi:beta-lactamase class C
MVLFDFTVSTIISRLAFFSGLFALALSQNGCIEDVASKPVNPVHHASPPVDPELQAFLKDYRQFFEASMALTQTPGAAVVVVKGDSIIFQQGFGVKKIGVTDSVDLHTVFRIGSLSKGFAGILTGILVQNGLLHWDEPVQHYYPAFTLRDHNQAKRMVLWHLLSHTTGLPYHAFTSLIERGFDTKKIVAEYFPQAPISGKEGVFFSYQNAAFCVIEEVMQGATQKTYPQLLQENVLSPAKMHFASCDFQSMQNCQDKALPHFWIGNTWRSDTISRAYYNAAAAGGVNASIADMGEWLKLLLGHKPEIISLNTLEKVFSPVVQTGKERRTFPRWINREDASYAMGWRVLHHNNDTIIYHGGYVNGFRSEIAFNRRDNIGICILFNASSDLCSTSVPAFFDRWDAVRSKIH